MARKLLVEGLDWGVNDAALRAAFAPFGRVVEARVAQDWETGRSRGFGFVTFDDETAARLAIETMDGTPLKGKVLRVMIAPDSPPRADYRGGDYGRVPSGDGRDRGAYRGGDYSDGRSNPRDGKLFRSADFGYVDGPTRTSAYRSADFEGPPTAPEAGPLPSPPAQPGDEAEAAPAPDDAPAATEGEDATTGRPARDGGGKGWQEAGEGFGGAGKKTFG